MAAPRRPDNLVDVEEIAERFHLKRETLWKKIRSKKLETVPGSGVHKMGRYYRVDPQEFGQYLLNSKVPAPEQPPAPDIRKQEPWREALTPVYQRIDSLKAALVRLEDKVDTLNRAVLAIIRNWRPQDATAGNKRIRRS